MNSDPNEEKKEDTIDTIEREEKVQTQKEMSHLLTLRVVQNIPNDDRNVLCLANPVFGTISALPGNQHGLSKKERFTDRPEAQQHRIVGDFFRAGLHSLGIRPNDLLGASCSKSSKRVYHQCRKGDSKRCLWRKYVQIRNTKVWYYLAFESNSQKEIRVPTPHKPCIPKEFKGKVREDEIFETILKSYRKRDQAN